MGPLPGKDRRPPGPRRPRAGPSPKAGRGRRRYAVVQEYGPGEATARSARTVAGAGHSEPDHLSYGWHEHGYEKVLYCVRGRIVFHTDIGDIDLGPGDRMVLPPHMPHAATVGTEGVRCIEAPRPGKHR